MTNSDRHSEIESPGKRSSVHQSIKWTIALGLSILGGYLLIFILLYPKTGVMIASLAVLLTVFFGWRMGLRAGLVAGLLCLPLNIILFNLVGENGIDVLFRVSGGLGSLIIILLGAAAGRVHDITAELTRQIQINAFNEEALRRSEERIRGLFDGLPIGIYQSTPDGKILSANRALLDLLGCREEELLFSTNVKNFYTDGKERERWKTKIEAEGTIHGYQVELQRKDGSTFWVEDNAHIVRDEHGNVAYFEGSLNDITERKKAEQAVLESESKYRNLLHSIPQKVFYKNTDLVYIAVNSSFAQDFNKLPEYFFGKTDFDLFPPDMAEKYRSDDRRILESGISEDLEEDYLHHGETRTVHTIKTPVYDERGEVSGVLGIFWDITERKQMKEALRQSEQRYQGLFERSPVSLWEEDFSRVKATIDQLKKEGVKDFKLYFEEHPEVVARCLEMIQVNDVNYATLDLFQADHKDMLMSNLSMVLTESAYDIFREELIAIAEGHTEFESEGQNCTLNGDTIDIHLRWSVAPGYEETLSKVIVSIVDITERKRAEEELHEQTARAEAMADILKGISAAGLEAQAIFGITVERIAKIIGDACVLTMVCDDNRWRKVVAFHHRDLNALQSMGQSLSTTPKLVEEGVIGQVLRTGEPLLLPMLSADKIEGMEDPEYEAYLYRTGVTSLVIVPLTAAGQAIGTLEVSRHHSENPFTTNEQDFLQNLANRVALTTMNARLHELVRYQARTDPLGGVSNRRYFLSMAEIEFSRAERYGHPLSIILLDLDNFKSVNDTYGHHTGDRLLQFVAKQCQENIRPADIIGRYGGDEFTILLPETDLAGARRLAERLREKIAESSVNVDGKSVTVTLSIGISSKGEDTPNFTALIHQADKAMYVAKRAGRNQVAG